jgi:hypothetical protein
MKDVMEVLRAREQDLVRVREEVEALRVAAPLLGEEEDSAWLRRREFRQSARKRSHNSLSRLAFLIKIADQCKGPPYCVTVAW